MVTTRKRQKMIDNNDELLSGQEESMLDDQNNNDVVNDNDRVDIERLTTAVVPSTHNNNNNNGNESNDDVIDFVWFQPLVNDDYDFQPLVNDNFELAKSNFIDMIDELPDECESSDRLMNVRDHLGMTALHHVCFSNEGILESNGGMDFIHSFLLNNGDINIKIRDNDGNIPLHTATQFGNIDIIKLLFEHEEEYGDDDDDDVIGDEGMSTMIHIRNNLGETPLYIAVENHYVEIIKLLLLRYSKQETVTSDTYFNIPNNNGITPIQLIYQHKKQVLLDISDHNNNPSLLSLLNEYNDKLKQIDQIIVILKDEELVQRLTSIYQFIWNSDFLIEEEEVE